jgi:hypothetical protein
VRLVKSGILCVLLRGIEGSRDGCFGVVSMVAQKAQVFSGRRIGGRLLRIIIKRIRSIIHGYIEIMRGEGIELVLMQGRIDSAVK